MAREPREEPKEPVTNAVTDALHDDDYGIMATRPPGTPVKLVYAHRACIEARGLREKKEP
jgi:hypothetical protein